MVSVAASNVFYGFRRGKERFFYGFRRGKGTFVYGFRRGRERLFMVSVVAGNVCLWFPSLVFYGFRRGRERFFMVSVVGFLWFPAATGPRLSLRWKP